MITGCLQQKNGFYYAVLYLKVNGRRRCKWVPMRLPVEGTSARKAQKAFDEMPCSRLSSTWKSGFNRPAAHLQRRPTKATLT